MADTLSQQGCFRLMEDDEDTIASCKRQRGWGPRSARQLLAPVGRVPGGRGSNGTPRRAAPLSRIRTPGRREGEQPDWRRPALREGWLAAHWTWNRRPLGPPSPLQQPAPHPLLEISRLRPRHFNAPNPSSAAQQPIDPRPFCEDPQEQRDRTPFRYISPRPKTSKMVSSPPRPARTGALRFC